MCPSNRCLITFFLLTWLVISQGLATNQEPQIRFLRTVSTEELDTILKEEKAAFITSFGHPPEGYLIPDYPPAKFAVDIYRVNYASTIPEMGHRPTRASGMIAIPQIKGTAPFDLVSYQHGTVFGKLEVPSHCFVPKNQNPQYEGSFENRLVVASFAGQGFIVIAADYFGFGDSKDPDGYTAKESHQQACLDMLLTAQKFLHERDMTVGNLYLSGWSLGGYVTLAFLEKLELETDISVKAASTASAPSDLFAAVNGFLYHARKLDASWLNTIILYTAFAYDKYYGIPVENVIRKEHLDVCRKLYQRDFSSVEEFIRLAKKVPANLHELLRSEYSNPRFFANSAYGKKLKENTVYRWLMRSHTHTFYGLSDEAIAVALGTLPADYQNVMGNGEMISAHAVPHGNHRGTFLTAIKEQLTLFQNK